jgi:hypothetical protein
MEGECDRDRERDSGLGAECKASERMSVLCFELFGKGLDSLYIHSVT